MRWLELMSALGFGKLVTSCHFALGDAVSEQAATGGQALSEEDTCAASQVPQLGKQLSCLPRALCYDTNIHLMRRHESHSVTLRPTDRAVSAENQTGTWPVKTTAAVRGHLGN